MSVQEEGIYGYLKMLSKAELDERKKALNILAKIYNMNINRVHINPPKDGYPLCYHCSDNGSENKINGKCMKIGCKERPVYEILAALAKL